MVEVLETPVAGCLYVVDGIDVLPANGFAFGVGFGLKLVADGVDIFPAGCFIIEEDEAGFIIKFGTNPPFGIGGAGALLAVVVARIAGIFEFGGGVSFRGGLAGSLLTTGGGFVVAFGIVF